MKYYVGLDLGGTNIAAGVVDENYNIVATHSTPTLARRGFEVVVEDMAKAARDVVKKAGIRDDEFLSVGIGTPSSIEPETRRVVFANNLGWHNAPLREEFGKYIDKPVFVANDADCAALGEAVAGLAKQYKSVLFITLGTGVGVGFIFNDQIFTGGNSGGIEPGHMTLVLDGIPCSCGRNGCYESYASVSALIRQTIEAIAENPDTLMREICENDLRKVSGRTAFEAAKKGDRAGQKVVDKYIYYISAGIKSLVSAYRPHAVLIGGGISNEGEYLLAPVRKLVHEDTLFSREATESMVIMKASLGNTAGIIGAAILETQINV